MKEVEKLKLIHQLFIGKVVEVIGFEKSVQLLKEAQEAIDELEKFNLIK